MDISERARNSVSSAGSANVEICTYYEAGYDGFWLHCFLITKGINAQVLDSASIQVSRRRRNAKTDQIDAEGLVRVLREVCTQIDALVQSVSRRKRSGVVQTAHPVARLMQIRGIGPDRRFGICNRSVYRKFSNRRAVASYVGLTPTPCNSGGSSRDQGISKAGNACARHYAVELAWLWLRNQPSSLLTAWFKE